MYQNSLTALIQKEDSLNHNIKDNKKNKMKFIFHYPKITKFTPT